MATRITLRSGDSTWTTKVDGGRVTWDGASADVTSNADGNCTIEIDGQAYHGAAVRDHDRVWVSVDGDLFDFSIEEPGSRKRSAGADQSALMAPMPATVLRVAAKAGQTVAEGDVLIVLEAMKMELSIRAPRAGMVKAVNCTEGDLVQADRALVEMH